MRAWVSANGLALHPDKTHVGDCRVEGQGFEFLADLRLEAGQRWVRKKSLMSLRDNIRAKTKRKRGIPSRTSLRLSIRPCAAGTATSNMRTGSPSPRSTASFAAGCGRCCAGRSTDRVKADADAITNNGRMPSSLTLGCSRCLRPIAGHEIPMWKQLTGEPVAGEPHSGFGGRGWRSPFPTPIRRTQGGRPG